MFCIDCWFNCATTQKLSGHNSASKINNSNLYKFIFSLYYFYLIYDHHFSLVFAVFILEPEQIEQTVGVKRHCKQITRSTYMYTAIGRQNAPSPISKIVEESEFSDTAYNSSCVSDVQSLIAKITLQPFFG